jgi:hypothetical protein
VTAKPVPSPATISTVSSATEPETLEKAAAL